MKYNYEKLDVYQLAKNYAAEIYKLTKDFPVQEQFGLTSQTRRAAVSIMLNIVEGSSRKSNKDFAIFVERAIGSLIETRAALDLTVTLGYLKEETRIKLNGITDELFLKLQALKKTLRSNNSKPNNSNDSNNSNK